MKKTLLATVLFVIIYFGINLNLFAYDYYGCIFSPDTTGWQFSHQNAYRLTTGKTANNTPTGHIQVQTEGLPSINQGSLLVYINGASVLLYTDPNLENSIGKNYSYQAGTSSKEFWFYTGFGQDSEIKLKHIEVQTWYVTWNMSVSCPDSNNNAPTIKINLQPDSNASLLLGQSVPVKWIITSSNTITHSHLSLYQNQVKKRILYQPDQGELLNYLWFVTDIPSGSGYQLCYYAKDNKGHVAEVKGNIFSIGSELIFNIPGHLLGNPSQNGTATPEVGFGVNSVGGNFYHNETDVSLPGIELPFIFTRHYNSQAIPIDSFGVLLNSPFGWNWSHSYLIQLRMNTSKTKAELIWDDGRRRLWCEFW